MFNVYFDLMSDAVFGGRTPAPLQTGSGTLPSVYGVSDFAAAAIGVAGAAMAQATGLDGDAVVVDRRRASMWFDMTTRPLGWDAPSIWDAIAGIYRTRDGWIRLHTNAPHHRDAATSVLRVSPDRDAVSRAVHEWTAQDLEAAIVAAKGCAAALHTDAEWQSHPQGRSVAHEPLIHWSVTGQTRKDTGAAGGISGLKVLDLTRVLAGPVATRFLAGFGADVLRIDPPFWSEPAAELEVTLGKRCAGLDLTQDEDRAQLTALIAAADIMVHGYRSDALEAMGFGAEMRRDLNPDLIDVSLNAYGWTGPWVTRRGFDSLVQMSCGIAAEGMARTGSDQPLPLPVQALDHGTGYLMAAAVLHAVAERRKGRILSARLSLARTAACLKAGRLDALQGSPLASVSGDFGSETENTSWGPVQRLVPPLTVGGAAPRWARPAGFLRRHPAQW